MLTLTLNGETIQAHANTLLDQILAEYLENIDLPFAVAINGVFVPRQQYTKTTLKQGDSIEVLSPNVGG
ncbi:sulfur carrier protein ThiS [Thiofilum flexile]|uniref:sulfur carrier protein ThiS n=1 Tax=Thiofilum flexile TaxID=125627 RepID=UPI00037764F6|nr:sulfur carrier protein ThiS [Thiofilum flexile]